MLFPKPAALFKTRNARLPIILGLFAYTVYLALDVFGLKSAQYLPQFQKIYMPTSPSAAFGNDTALPMPDGLPPVISGAPSTSDATGMPPQQAPAAISGAPLSPGAQIPLPGQLPSPGAQAAGLPLNIGPLDAGVPPVPGPAAASNPSIPAAPGTPKSAEDIVMENLFAKDPADMALDRAKEIEASNLEKERWDKERADREKEDEEKKAKEEQEEKDKKKEGEEGGKEKDKKKEAEEGGDKAEKSDDSGKDAKTTEDANDKKSLAKDSDTSPSTDKTDNDDRTSKETKSQKSPDESGKSSSTPTTKNDKDARAGTDSDKTAKSADAEKSKDASKETDSKKATKESATDADKELADDDPETKTSKKRKKPVEKLELAGSKSSSGPGAGAKENSSKLDPDNEQTADNKATGGQGDTSFRDSTVSADKETTKKSKAKTADDVQDPTAAESEGSKAGKTGDKAVKPAKSMTETESTKPEETEDEEGESKEKKRVYPDLEPTDPNYFAMCLAVGNQAKDLPEFFTHHYHHHGVRNFYVMDDRSDPPMESFLDTFPIPASAITFVYNKEKRNLGQQLLYDECNDLFGQKHVWLAYFDVDEFLEVKDEDETIQSILASLPDNTGSLGVQWIMHNSNGLLERPKSARKAFTECVADDLEMIKENPDDNDHVKSIVKTSEYVTMQSPHHAGHPPGMFQMGEHNQPFSGPWRRPPTRDRVALHHYCVKSKEEYEEKMQRGNGQHQPKQWDFWEHIEELPTMPCPEMVKYDP